MSLALDTAPVNKYAILLTFTWGSTPTVATYTNWDYDLVLNGVTYISVTTIEAESSSAQNGGTVDVPWYVRMPINLHPADYLTRIYPWAVVKCRIEECNPMDTTNTQRRTLFYGNVGKGTQNKSGSKKLAQLDISGLKQLLQFSSGMVSDQQCAWALGDSNCCVDLTPITQTATITTINKSVITLSSIVTPGTDTTYWVLGSMVYDDLTLLIRAFSGTTFQMEKLVPPEWLGQTIKIIPGCDKYGSTCTGRFDNISQFAGFGIAIPSYHPVLETSGK